MKRLMEHVRRHRERSWQWFLQHADSRRALFWLAVLAFADAIFFPIAAEAALVVLVLAHPPRAKQYWLVAITSSVVGAAVGYCIAAILFHQFGEPLLHAYGLLGAFTAAKHAIARHVFLAMSIASFMPLPDKAFIYAGGFLGVSFLPFIAGYAIGRGARMAACTFIVEHFGDRVFKLVKDYLVLFTLAILALLVYYVVVHYHMLPL